MRHHGMISVALSLLLCCAGAVAQPQCDRLTTGPTVGPPALADGVRLFGAVEIDLDVDGSRDLLLVGQDRFRNLVLQVAAGVGGRQHARVVTRIDNAFVPPYYYYATPDRIAAQVRDFDNDRDDDLVLTVRSLFYDQQTFTFLNDGAGLQLIPAPADCVLWSIVGDFDGDQRGELVVHHDEPTPYGCDGGAPSHTELYDLDGDSTWQLSAVLPTLDFTGNPVAADYDGDGYDDLVYSSHIYGTYAFEIRFGNPLAPLSWVNWDSSDSTSETRSFRDSTGDGFLQRFPTAPLHAVRRYDALRQPVFFPLQSRGSLLLDTDSGHAFDTVADIDGDGVVDFTLTRVGRVTQLWHGVSTGQPFVPTWSIGPPYRLASGIDLDGDRTNEGLIFRTNEDGLTSWQADGVGGFVDPRHWAPAPETTQSARVVLSGDLNHDRRDDLVIRHNGYDGDSGQYVLLSRADGEFDRAADVYSTGERVVESWLLDLDNDGTLDLVTHSRGINRSALESRFGTGTGTFGAGHTVELPRDAVVVAQGDLNGDATTDFLVQDQLTLVQLLSRGRRFDPGVSQSTPYNYWEVKQFLADLDGDGTNDLLLARQRSRDNRGNVATLLERRRGLARGLFGSIVSSWSGELPLPVERIDILDLDADGDRDLFVQLQRGTLDRPNATLLNDRRGNFTLVWTGPSRGHENEGLYDLRDIDNDGYVDLVERERTFRIRRGTGTGSFDTSTAASVNGAARTDALADVDGDGVVDTIAWDLDQTWQRTVALGQATRAASDTEPPSAFMTLWPDSTSFDGESAWDVGRFRLGAAASDDCSAATITKRRIDVVPVAAGSPVLFRVSDREEIAIYEQPSTGARSVLLDGRNEQAARARFAAVLAAGGWEFPTAHVAQLVERSEFGSAPDDVRLDPAARRIALYRLTDNLPNSISVTSPVEQIGFTVAAIDRAGRRTTVHESLRAVRDRFCSTANALHRACTAD